MNKFARSLPLGHLLRESSPCPSHLTRDQRSSCFHDPSWRSLFFYLCTDEISFAPLTSQGIDSRLAYILENASDTPPPCSPKSVYILASLLNLQPLSDLALRDIESKLSENNIVEEFFSRVSSTQREVLEMECRLFFSRFKNQATVLRMQEKIASIGASRAVHQADAFKLGLQAALDFKKRDSRAELGGVMLRCPGHDCPGNKSYTSYSPEGVPNSEFCQPCFEIGRKCLLICTGCGYERTGRDLWCQRCGKRFVLVVSSPS
ncbi:hypothetical protein BDM02DRAFT_489896 [Thelephora ganbajun]|uniref:Uncharacterized protein n=1 Tax=Thelephora ganbajun TaxID=370292 RepID=A0ACB6Z7W6_THEGA|nr:hypothetical protein BDM02DRAFT_489896 [Thelephora ganbajun]